MKKLLIFGIIALFIGLAFIPSFNAVSISMLDNHPPSPPQIKGPSKGLVGTHEWTFKSFDPDGDNVSYLVDWGDSTGYNWNGPHLSGVEVTISHTYTDAGTFVITALANDTHDAVSDVSTLPVLIYQSKHIINQIQETTSDSEEDCDCQSEDTPICNLLNKTIWRLLDYTDSLIYIMDTLPEGSKLREIYGTMAYIIGIVVVGYISGIAFLLDCEFVPH